MAVTTIHPIRSTLNQAIDYIINPHKTEEQKYVDGFNCVPRVACKKFERTRDDAYDGNKPYARNGNLPIIGQHIIQSFSPEDNVTPEQAHEIGKKLMEELCGGRFEYVISTHVDKAHIHNHIIVNNVSFETKRTFETELNRGGKVWKKLRNISDKLCEENDLSVIKMPEIGKGKSHYEWEQDNRGNSWKSLLRKNIDECVIAASSFDDFLEQMRKRGYDIKRGKHISFRAEGQERFTRGKTVGWYYDEEHIRGRIDGCIERRKRREEYEKHLAVKAANNPYITDDYIGRAIDLNSEKFRESDGLRRWAMLQNMQNTSKLLNQLAEKNIGSPAELDGRIVAMYDTRLDIGDKIKLVEKELDEVNSAIENISVYLKNNALYKQYKAAKNPDEFFREYESELRDYELARKAVKTLLKSNGKLPNLQDLNNRQAALMKQNADLTEQYNAAKSEISALIKLRKEVRDFGIDDKNKAKTDNIT